MGGRVLVVDDSRTIRTLVGRALTAAGYEMIEAADGVDALAKLEGLADSTVLVCDINMPNMNGLELLAALRQRGRRLPIVILTSDVQPQHVALARDGGASAFVAKPFKADALITTIQSLVA
jgi:two-component system chemotaxis response regulator CheY